VGWLDGALLRYAIAVNGVSELALTKLDILSGLSEIKVGVAYRYQGQVYPYPPFGVSSSKLGEYEPVYETLPAWQKDVRSARSWDDLPAEAQHFIHKVSEIAGVPVSLISVGPERDHVIKIAA